MARNYVNLAEIMGQVDNARANEMQMKRQQQQMQMEDYAYQKALEQDQEQKALKGVYSGAIDTTGEAPKLNEQKLIQDLMQRGYGEQALKLQDQFRTRDMQAGKLQNEAKSSDLKYQMDLTNYAHDAMAGATPETWGMLKQDLMTKGVKAAEAMPDTFDPNFQSKFVMDAKSFREQNKPQEYGTGVSYDENNRAFVMDKFGNPKFIGTSKAPDAASKVDYNKPFLPDGSPNTAYQNYEMTKKGENEAGYSTKPLPTTALKLQNETLDKLSIANNNNVKLKEFESKISNGELDLGLFSNIAGNVRNRAGMSNESSRNLTSFKSSIEKLRNDSLRLNTGVQTDGDAQRAWNELFESINDKDVVLQRLKEIQEINARGADLQKLQVENIRSNYNAAPIDFNKYEAAPAKPAKPATLAKPKAGTIDSGYVFLGGDPANPKSWKKAK